MPFRSRRPRRRRLRRRRRARPRFRRRGTMLRTRAVSGFPDSMIVNLKYSVSGTTTAAGLTFLQFRGNGPFDPEFSGIGHQPMMFDQYAAVYDRYLVFGSTCQVLVTSNAATSAHYVALLPSTSSTLPYTDLNDVREASYSKVRLVGQREAGNATVNLFGKMSTKKIRGEQVLDDSFGALVTAVPQRQWFWSWTAILADLSASSVNLRYMVTLNYRVKFHKRKNVAGS